MRIEISLRHKDKISMYNVELIIHNDKLELYKDRIEFYNEEIELYNEGIKLCNEEMKLCNEEMKMCNEEMKIYKEERVYSVESKKLSKKKKRKVLKINSHSAFLFFLWSEFQTPGVTLPHSVFQVRSLFSGLRLLAGRQQRMPKRQKS